MKLIRSFFIICVAVGISACDDGVPENLDFEQFKSLYLSSAGDRVRRVSFPADMKRDTSFVFGNIAYGGTMYFGQGNIVAEIGADFSLIEAYNTENNSTFEPLPEESFAFSMTKLVIENGMKYSGVSNLFLSPSKLEAGTEYMLPVTIKSTTGEIAVNDEKKTAYWAFVVRSEDDDDDNGRPIPIDLVSLDFRAETAMRMTVTQESDFTILRTDGNDPFVSTTVLGRTLLTGRTILAMEYKSNKTVTNAQFFYCVNGGAAGGVSSAQNITVPEASDWTWFEFDLSEAISRWGFGVNNSGGRPPTEHFLRYDPVADGAGYEISIRKFQIEVH